MRRTNPKTALQMVIEVECTRCGWSLRDLARAADMLPQTLNALLKLGNPRMDQLQRLAAALGVEATQLVRTLTPAEYGAALMQRRPVNHCDPT